VQRPLRELVALAAASLAFAALVSAPAAAGRLSIPLGDTPLEACGCDPIEPDCDHPIEPDRIVEGTFPRELQGAYVMLPFEVPAGTTSVRVQYCWEEGGHTVDLGLWHARPGKKPWGPSEFRGWGGSSHPDVTITPQGFSPEVEYVVDPKGHVPGFTTRGFVPGAIPAGTWAAELGVGAIAPNDPDGAAHWRVEIELAEDPAFAAEPYAPAPYDATPANPEPGWYQGDMHVHAEHSALGDATTAETLEFAFRSLEAEGAGLDFITLSDYVTTSGWGEIGRHQPAHPGKLVIRSSEVITYRGHSNNHASLRYVDHRIGPVYELREDGRLKLLRGDRDPRQNFKEIQQAGGWTQLNHVSTCPSSEPYCRQTCRGCPWDFSRHETKLGFVDAIEIASGVPALFAPTNIFTTAAIDFWEDALDRGERIAAVGSSDSHHAGTPTSPLQSPIGTAATVVYARELSEAGIRDGVRAGHTYVKIFGSAMPDVRLEAFLPGASEPAGIMGDAIRAKALELRAQVLGVPAEEAGALELLWLKDGAVVAAGPVSAPTSEHALATSGPGRYRIELRRGEEILVLTSPIYVTR
jgi:hypothetical protein